jgi:hypothetical protein
MHNKKPEFVKVYKEYSTETVKFFTYIRKETKDNAEYKKEPKRRPSARP